MFSSSSRSGNVVNQDGSHNVRCYQCGAFIAKTFLRIDRALCAMCEMALSGKVISEETLRQYMLSKKEKVSVSMALVPADEAPKEFTAKFTLRSMGDSLMRAIGIPKPKQEEPASVKAARRKKRPRLFENVDLAAEAPATMESVDAALKKNSSR